MARPQIKHWIQQTQKYRQTNPDISKEEALKRVPATIRDSVAERLPSEERPPPKARPPTETRPTTFVKSTSVVSKPPTARPISRQAAAKPARIIPEAGVTPEVLQSYGVLPHKPLPIYETKDQLQEREAREKKSDISSRPISFQTMAKGQRRALARGNKFHCPTATIKFAVEPMITYPDFPIFLLAFASAYAYDILSAGSDIVTIPASFGGSVAQYARVLQWIRDIGDAGTYKSFDLIDFDDFVQVARLAVCLGIRDLERACWDYYFKLYRNKMPPSDRIEKMAGVLPPTSRIMGHLADTIAYMIRENARTGKKQNNDTLYQLLHPSPEFRELVDSHNRKYLIFEQHQRHREGKSDKESAVLAEVQDDKASPVPWEQRGYQGSHSEAEFPPLGGR